MDYNGLVLALETAAVIMDTNADWQAILPSVINDAEGRIYKAMDFLATRKEYPAFGDPVLNFTPGSRELAIPAGSLITVLEQVGWYNASTDETNFPDFVSYDLINAFWPQQDVTGDIKWWSLKNDTTVIVAGTPASGYPATLIGKARPNPISAANTTTYLSLNHPELLVAACMVFVSGYQKNFGNFGAAPIDPAMAISWETAYQDRLKVSMAEEMRRKNAGSLNQSAQPMSLPNGTVG